MRFRERERRHVLTADSSALFASPFELPGQGTFVRQEPRGKDEGILDREPRLGEVLSFPEPVGSEPIVRMELEARDPVAHPVYKARVDGAAHPIYQLCEEPMKVTASEAQPVVSPKMELDISAFLEALHSAFPHPRDPLVRPVLRARPSRAARPFLYRARPEEAALAPEPEAAGEQEQIDRPYDPILDPLAEPLGSRPVSQRTQGSGMRSELAAGTETRRRVWEERAEETQERRGLEAIEPVEPVAKPRLPRAPAELPKRLSPSQRAALRRPATVLDRDGRTAEVMYRADAIGLV